MRRRDFLAIPAAILAAGARGLNLSGFSDPKRTHGPAPRRLLRAVAFDAFTVFDPRPIGALAETVFPGKGTELDKAWRARQFEYQWLRALSGRYADFWQVTQDALVFAARSLDLRLTTQGRARLMQAWLHLETWPEVPASLRALRDGGLRLAFLSNLTEGMLKTGVENAGLEGIFEHVLSTDAVMTYKPDPLAYRLASDAFDLPPEAVLFAASAGWDAAGSRWFGYPTYWVNRPGLPGEELGVAADAEGPGLQELTGFALERGGRL